MPFVRERSREMVDRAGVLGPCVGRASGFYALAYCPGLDEAEIELNRDHSEVTHILRYHDGRKEIVGRYPQRLDGLWQGSDGSCIAVGVTSGHVTISEQGLVDVNVPGIQGVFTGIWGADDRHVYAVGGNPAFAMCMLDGTWTEIRLPSIGERLQGVSGLSVDDVYFVGAQGRVYHFNGRAVAAIRVPAQFGLTCAVPFDKQQICVGGYQGTLMVGAGARWRRIQTHTRAPLLSLGVLDGRIFFSAEGYLWSTDGVYPATPVLQWNGDWVSGLADGLVLVDGSRSCLYHEGRLIELDTFV